MYITMVRGKRVHEKENAVSAPNTRLHFVLVTIKQVSWHAISLWMLVESVMHLPAGAGLLRAAGGAELGPRSPPAAATHRWRRQRHEWL